jgi:DNA-directed RNA polymerase subunit H
MKKIDVTSHKMVPKHRVLTPEEAEEVCQRFGIVPQRLPKIQSKDPAVKAIAAQPGDILRIERESETAGVSVAYRIVVE